MSDGKSFIRSLAICHPSQATPLLRNSTDGQLMAMQQVVQNVLSKKIPLNTKLPKQFRRRLHNIAFRHATPQQIRRSLTQRGGNAAVMAGKVMKTLAHAAAPHLKTVGKVIVQEGISKGIENIRARIKGKKTKKLPPPFQVSNTPPTPSDPDQEELDRIVNQALQKEDNDDSTK